MGHFVALGMSGDRFFRLKRSSLIRAPKYPKRYSRQVTGLAIEHLSREVPALEPFTRASIRLLSIAIAQEPQTR
jgi:hypothetical protein